MRGIKDLVGEICFPLTSKKPNAIESLVIISRKKLECFAAMKEAGWPFSHGILHTCWYAWIASENCQDLRSNHSQADTNYPTLVPESNELCKWLAGDDGSIFNGRSESWRYTSM
ncbi:predicted protein [Lichtheimia corymbifera JMRC:FSU:9682]|uniref:Uncharacterized protein n=1 Tax=Lichtheimia corymbifera JMRC:FSU:9682 TaxID=1263082 RepID=A0A068RJL6_9FUNG|nr:predicted protein [Lichtheimia corymbifera JMRC:FSU:9682]